MPPDKLHVRLVELTRAQVQMPLQAPAPAQAPLRRRQALTLPPPPGGMMPALMFPVAPPQGPPPLLQLRWQPSEEVGMSEI